MNRRYIVASIIIVGLLAITGAALYVVSQQPQPYEDPAPTKIALVATLSGSGIASATPTADNIAKSAPATTTAPTTLPTTKLAPATSTATTSPTPPLTSPAQATQNTPVAPVITDIRNGTPVAIVGNPPSLPTSTPRPVGLTQGRPKIIQVNYTLPAGLAPSDELQKCPNPLPLDKIEDDYLAYWTARVQAYKETNSEILQPYIETAAAGGQFWNPIKADVDKLKSGDYYLDIQVSHADPLAVQLDPYSANECHLFMIDGFKTSSTYKLKPGATVTPAGTEYPPTLQQQPANQAFNMVLRNGHWVVYGLAAIR